MPRTCATNVEAVDRVDVEPIEHRGRRRDAGGLVTARSDPSVLECGRGRLAEIVQQRAEHDRDAARQIEIVDAVARAVDDQQRVHPDVAFGMPLGLLRAVDESPPARARASARRRARGRASARSTGAPREAAASPLSPQMRSAGRSSSGIAAQRRAVAGSSAQSKRAANCSARSTRRLSSAKVRASTMRSTRASRSARPPKGSRYSPVSGSQAIALIVKSRRRAASSIESVGSPTTSNPLWPRPTFDSRRGSETSRSATLKTVKLSPTVLTEPNARQQRLERRRLEAVDLEVDVLGFVPEQPIADPAADDERTSAFRADGARDLGGDAERVRGRRQGVWRG